jgi:hypothetical protein
MARRRSTPKGSSRLTPRASRHAEADAAAEARLMMGWLTLDGVQARPPQGLPTRCTLLDGWAQPLKLLLGGQAP